MTLPALASTSRPVRLLQVAGNAIVGGMETCVLELLKRLPRTRFEVTVLCPFEGRFAERLRMQGHDVIITPMPADEVSWSSLQAACALIRLRGFDILHAHLPNAHLLAGLAGSLTGTPVVATMHGRQITQLDFEAQRLTATHLHVVCRQTSMHALSLGVDAGRVHFIANGVDLQIFKPRNRRSNTLRESLGMSAEGELVGFIGRLSPEKGPDVFLRVAAAIHQRRPDVHFLAIGDGPMLGELVQQTRRLGLRRHLHFLPATEDIASVYGELDVLVHCSHSEAMPLVLMEAMASGLPLVATHVGGVPEIVVTGMTGLLCAPGDYQQIASRVAELLADPERRARMGAAARRHAERCFSVDRSVDALIDLFTQLSGNAATAPEATINRPHLAALPASA